MADSKQKKTRVERFLNGVPKTTASLARIRKKLDGMTTWEKVLYLLKRKFAHREIAYIIGCTPQNVSNVTLKLLKDGKIKEEEIPPKAWARMSQNNKAEKMKKRQAKQEKLRQIYSLYNDGWSYKQIANEVKLCKSAVTQKIHQAFESGVLKRRRTMPSKEEMERQRARIVELYRKKCTWKQIQKETKVSTAIARRAFSKAGIEVGPNFFTGFDRKKRNARIIKLDSLGYDYEQIAKKVSTSQPTVNRVLKENGITYDAEVRHERLVRRILDFHEKGYSMARIEKDTKRSTEFIEQVIRENAP